MTPIESGNKFTRTPKGIRADIKIYFYPDGHGNVVNGKLSRPFRSEVEAVRIYETLIREGFEAASGLSDS